MWTRPENVPYPSVWHTFKGRRPLDDGTVPTFRIQDLMPDKFEEALEFLCNDFLYNEPMCKSLNAAQDGPMLKQMSELWREMLADRMALVCYREDPSYEGGVCPEIVGLNMTYVGKIEEKDQHPQLTDDIFSQIMGTVFHCSELVDVFKLYNVTEYLSAAGLSVSKKYRGQNIGAEILKARIPLCKAMGLKVTSTVFTAIESQVLAKKVGFQDVGEVSYDELRNVHGYALGTIPSTKTCKLMTLEIH